MDRSGRSALEYTSLHIAMIGDDRVGDPLFLPEAGKATFFGGVSSQMETDVFNIVLCTPQRQQEQ